MKKTKLVTASVSACALLALGGQSAFADNFSSYLHSDGFQYACIAYTNQCASYQHTWAETTGCGVDMLQSWGPSGWSGDMLCYLGGDSSCSFDRWLGYVAQWSRQDGCNENAFYNSYSQEDPGTYGLNGVCHQATNRALNSSSVPWVSQLPVALGGQSYGVWHYCGTSWPWGNWYGCP